MATADTFHEFEQAGWGDEARAQAYHRHLGDVTTGCIPPLLDAAGVGPGDRVLDVACGAGYVAAAARDRGAAAVGLDFSAAQVRLAEATYPGLRFVEGDAEALPFDGDAFTAVVNAFGMPHVPDPDRAAAEAHRVLAPGGRFAYASWCAPEQCLAFSIVYDAIRAHGSLDVGLPPGPDFFNCGRPAYAQAMLDKAGFGAISIREVPLVWRASSPDAFIDGIVGGTVRAAATLSRQTPESLERIKDHLRRRVGEFAQDGAYAVPAPTLVVAARKSA